MNDAKSIIKMGMAKVKLDHDYELAESIGITRQTFSRKMLNPRTFTVYEIQALAKRLGWTNEELGNFIRSI